MRPLRADEKRLRSFDGTELAWHALGEGPPILLANGLGGSWKAWSHQVAYFGQRRFLSWDYRGLYKSAPPADPDAITMVDHARDALAVLDAANAEPAIVFAWSMGVQVALELFHRAPERVRALVLVNGVAGKPWDTLLDTSAFRNVMPRALRIAAAMPNLLSRATRRVVAQPETVAWVKRIGLAGRTLDEELWGELAASFGELDMGAYVRTLEKLGEHDAWSLLGSIDVPTLIIAGDRDVMTPRSAAERCVRAIPGAELLVVPGGTHYVAVEYPELVNLRVEKFFRERGL